MAATGPPDSLLCSQLTRSSAGGLGVDGWQLDDEKPCGSVLIRAPGSAEAGPIAAAPRAEATANAASNLAVPVAASMKEPTLVDGSAGHAIASLLIAKAIAAKISADALAPGHPLGLVLPLVDDPAEILQQHRLARDD